MLTSIATSSDAGTTTTVAIATTPGDSTILTKIGTMINIGKHITTMTRTTLLMVRYRKNQQVNQVSNRIVTMVTKMTSCKQAYVNEVKQQLPNMPFAKEPEMEPPEAEDSLL